MAFLFHVASDTIIPSGDREGEENLRGITVRQPSRSFVRDANAGGLIAFLGGPHAADLHGAALPIEGAWVAGRNDLIQTPFTLRR